MKKILAFVVLLTLIATAVCCCACQQADFTIGICQIAKHDALDAATNGFIDALTAEMQRAGRTVKFLVENAQGEATTCSSIIEKFTQRNVNLILANATAPLQVAAEQTRNNGIPVLGTSITDYKTALLLKNFDNNVVGGNVSGTSDLAPLDKQAQMILDLVPNAQKVGLLFCSAEANSRYQVDEIKRLLPNTVTCTEYAFADSNDINAVANRALSQSDVVYIPTDNTAASCASIIGEIAKTQKKPIITGEENLCKLCGIACLSIDYYTLGQNTGVMAANILLNNADISTMPVQFCDTPTYKYNKQMCQELGVSIPSNYVEIK